MKRLKEVRKSTQATKNVIIHPSAVIEDGVLFSDNFEKRDAPITIGKDCVIGAGAILLKGVNIGQGSRVLPGSIVKHDTPPQSVIQGNPARVVNYTASSDHVNGIIEHPFDYIKNQTGVLSVCVSGKNAPFEFKRTFTLIEIESGNTRGNHAHKECHQFLTCYGGKVELFCDDGVNRKVITLEQMKNTVHVLPGTWIALFNFEKGAVVTVHTSHEYDEADYLRDYAEFLTYKKTLLKIIK